MEIRLYKNLSSDNTINKNLELIEVENIAFKNEADLLYPSVDIKGVYDLECNYVFIPEFGRHYFVDGVSYLNNKIYRLKLRVDVLESFKEQILLCHGYVNEGTEVNPYYDNNNYEVEITKDIMLHKNEAQIEIENTLVMVTLGGV